MFAPPAETSPPRRSSVIAWAVVQPLAGKAGHRDVGEITIAYRHAEEFVVNPVGPDRRQNRELSRNDVITTGFTGKSRCRQPIVCTPETPLPHDCNVAVFVLLSALSSLPETVAATSESVGILIMPPSSGST
ncbi:hypothetical protein EB835_11095 [Brevibacterium sp. S22]|nr:hypothetical protein EB835_11095 [Brevibacterium sp. S22]